MAQVALQIRLLSARGLREVAPELFARGAVQPYCLCEVMGRDEPSFRTRAVDEGDTPTWDESTEMVIEEGESLIFMVNYKDDGTEDDLIGWAKLEHDKMVPSGFVGELRLTDAAAINKAPKAAEPIMLGSNPGLPHWSQPCKTNNQLPQALLKTISCPAMLYGILPKDAMAVEWPFADHDHNCLGGTFGACVFFDVPMSSPETLWSACETVQGGGVVCLVLPPELTETKCCALQEEAADIVPDADQKLGEALLPRIVQSLWQMPVCGFVDASLTLLSTKQIGLSASLTPPSLEPQTSPEATDALLELCCTACQRKAFTRLQASLVAAGQASKGRQTVLSLTGRRGRGKSSVAGLFVAAALQCGRNVVVTGPARNSVQGIFRFAARAMGVPAPEVSCSTLSHARARYLPAEAIPGFASALALVNDAPVLVVDEMASLPIPQLHQLLVAPAPLILQRFLVLFRGQKALGQQWRRRSSKSSAQTQPRSAGMRRSPTVFPSGSS
ncbi:l(1)G0020 [Symbiodinium sp. CCMP2592]|nr:l(1)G0020 [Symbiodinium sp. CCMP2592]